MDMGDMAEASNKSKKVKISLYSINYALHSDDILGVEVLHS
jgi:hypothetical protein